MGTRRCIAQRRPPFAEQNGVMFVIADHASYRDKICGNLLALMLDTNCIHG